MKRVKRLHLMTLALAAVLLFGYMPLTVQAGSINGQGGLVGDDNPGAGDTLPVGDTTPAATPAAQNAPTDPATPDTPDEPATPDAPENPVNPEEIDDNGVPLDAGQGQGQQEQSEIGENDVPLATVTTPTEEGFPRWGIALGAGGVIVVGGGVAYFAVLAGRKRGKGSKKP